MDTQDDQAPIHLSSEKQAVAQQLAWYDGLISGLHQVIAQFDGLGPPKDMYSLRAVCVRSLAYYQRKRQGGGRGLLRNPGVASTSWYVVRLLSRIE